MKSTFTLGLLCVGAGMMAQSSDLSRQISESEVSSEMKELLLYWVDEESESSAQKAPGIEYPRLELAHKHVSRAPQDGCYYGIGDPRNKYVIGGMSKEECIECEKSGGKIKTNESYVWGLTQGNGQIYFGVNTNYLCVAMADMTQGGLTSGLPAYENECWACEYDKSSHKDSYGPMWGDWKAPRIYHYNPLTGNTDDMTPLDDANMDGIYGLRAAGSLNNLSFIAGPNKGNNGVTFFAFDNITNEPKGSFVMQSLPDFEGYRPFNIRRSVVIDGILYFGIEYKDIETGKSNGALLRWYGNDENPFQFKVVGWIPKGASEFAVLKNKLYVGTWPLSVCRSGEIPADGFQPVAGKPTAEDQWKTVFNYSSYEPDQTQSFVTYCGGMTVYKDQIYFGAIHMTWGNHFIIPGLYKIDPLKDIEGFINAFFGSYRASALFRLSVEEDPEKQNENLDVVSSHKTKDGCKIELLYGEEKLPAYNRQTKKWTITPTGWTPVFGKSGFNNKFINYVWSANVYQDKLFLGTMDYSNLIIPQIESITNTIGYPIPTMIKSVLDLVIKSITPSGFDLVYIDDPNKKAKIINRSGYGNEAAYGIRNIINVDDKMYFGTANPLSLHEKGGWEILEVNKGIPVPDLTIDWNPAPVSFGETISEQQLNATVVYNGQQIPGTYYYSYCWDEVPVDTIFTPGYIDLRVEFRPTDSQQYPVLTSKQRIDVRKATLNVVAPNVEMDMDSSFPVDEYKLAYDGFVLGHDESILKNQPTWKIEVPENASAGEYPIRVAGGESDLYELIYHQGKLIVRVPSALAENKEGEIRVYPVPVKDRIYFEGGKEIRKVALISLDGKEVLSVDFPGESMDLSGIAPAAYMLKIDAGETTLMRKIFVTK
ncbi:MAG: T9SS type A sorting domain-containing protein [Bacteroidales bacterium]